MESLSGNQQHTGSSCHCFLLYQPPDVQGPGVNLIDRLPPSAFSPVVLLPIVYSVIMLVGGNILVMKVSLIGIVSYEYFEFLFTTVPFFL